MDTTDKIQVGGSTTGTSTSTTYKVPSLPAEHGWICPRCNRVNAPWKSTCDCSGGYYYPIWEYKEPWWKYVTCDSDTFKVHPDATIFKAPSSVCGSDSTTCKVDGTTTAWNANSAVEIGGSDYWNSCTKVWENLPHTLTNVQKNIDMINETLKKMEMEDK